MSVNELQSVRQQLQDKAIELDQRLTRIEADRQRSTAALSPDFEEQATERENDDVLDRLAISTRDQFRQVRFALERIDLGLFGVCAKCGKPIAADRLQALPEATECAQCAAAH